MFISEVDNRPGYVFKTSTIITVATKGKEKGLSLIDDK